MHVATLLLASLAVAAPVPRRRPPPMPKAEKIALPAPDKLADVAHFPPRAWVQQRIREAERYRALYIFLAENGLIPHDRYGHAWEVQQRIELYQHLEQCLDPGWGEAYHKCKVNYLKSVIGKSAFWLGRMPWLP